jgi:hypothetical protein
MTVHFATLLTGNPTNRNCDFGDYGPISHERVTSGFFRERGARMRDNMKIYPYGKGRGDAEHHETESLVSRRYSRTGTGGVKRVQVRAGTEGLVRETEGHGQNRFRTGRS